MLSLVIAVETCLNEGLAQPLLEGCGNRGVAMADSGLACPKLAAFRKYARAEKDRDKGPIKLVPMSSDSDRMNRTIMCAFIVKPI